MPGIFLDAGDAAVNKTDCVTSVFVVEDRAEMSRQI